MVEGNKILTVSYGTFSCTLEGFEDSFTTMKAVAEYFRDLASDDRYFGAEPPTPDAAMLARIAEREVSRRVEATVDGNDVVLRTQVPTTVALTESETEHSSPIFPVAEPIASDVDEVVETAETEETGIDPFIADTSSDTTVETSAVDQDADDSIEAAAEESFEDTTDVEDVSVDDAPETSAEDNSDNSSFAAKLQRIRAVVTPDQAQTDETIYSEDQHASEGAPISSIDFDDTPLSEEVEATEDAASFMDSEFADTVDIPFEDDMSSVLASLAQADDTVDLDLPANLVDETDTFFDQESSAEDTEFEKIEDLAAAPQTDEDILGALSSITSDISTDDLDVSDTDHIDLDEQHDVEEIDTNEDQPQASKSPIARVIKVKRKDFDAALSAGDLEEIDASEEMEFAPEELAEDATDADTITNSVANALGSTSLSDEDEAELMAELAAVEQEVQSSETEDASETEEESVAEMMGEESSVDEPLMLEDIDMLEADGRSVTIIPQVDDDDELEAETAIESNPASKLHELADTEDDNTVERLLSKTQNEFDQPETGRRRNAIAHLKAAVAATRAERDSQGELEEVGDQTNTYREDLAKVVQPRRAAKPNKRSERPTPKVPPLTLVAAQRVDVDPDSIEEKPEQSSSPVRPRRVAKGQPNTSPEDINSFQEFAEANGARELPELLEAAAAYATYVKGEPHFTRPELMRKVNNVARDESISREDNLRSFGQLLREGKIVKLKKGTFTVAEDTRFRPDEARFAGE